MKTNFEINVSRSEAIRRYVLGTALIGVVLISPAVPSWIALFACYPIFTAMTQWDPANALFQQLTGHPLGSCLCLPFDHRRCVTLSSRLTAFSLPCGQSIPSEL